MSPEGLYGFVLTLNGGGKLLSLYPPWCQGQSLVVPEAQGPGHSVTQSKILSPLCFYPILSLSEARQPREGEK